MLQFPPADGGSSAIAGIASAHAGAQPSIAIATAINRLLLGYDTGRGEPRRGALRRPPVEAPARRTGEGMAASSSGTPANGPPSARFLLSGATNNPHQSWLGYFGIPEDIAEWTIDDVRSTVASIAPSVVSAAPAAAGANGSAVPPPPASLRRTVTLADFDRYLRTIGEPYRFFATSRPAVVGADSSEAGGGGLRGVPDRAVPDKGGEAPGVGHLASAATADRLKAVPPIVFSDSFELTEPETFRVFSPDGAPAASMVMIEKLANYLDQVPGHGPRVG